MAKKNIDMTQGSLMRSLVAFSVPLALSGLLQQLYSWADSFIVGNMEGESALAAVGASGSVSRLITLIITGFTAGLAVWAAQQFGMGRRERLREILAAFAPLCGAVSATAALVMGAGAMPMLRLFDTPADIFSMSVAYLRFYLIGTPFMAVYNVYAAVLRGMGDSRAPFLAIVVSSAANVLLDLLFVGVFGWGAAGAALATSISQILMTVFVLGYTVRKYPGLSFDPRKIRPDAAVLREGFFFGLPMALSSSIQSVGSMLLQGFQNSFGTATVAAISTAYRIDSVMLLPVMNLGHGVSTAVGQNIGGGHRARASRTLWVGLGMIGAVSLVLTAVVLCFGGSLIALFGVSNEAVDIGRRFFIALGSFYPVFAAGTAVQSYLKGLGDMKFTSAVQIAVLALRLALSYAMKPHFGNMSIAYAEAVCWTVLLLVWSLRAFQLRQTSGRNAGREQN